LRVHCFASVYELLRVLLSKYNCKFRWIYQLHFAVSCIELFLRPAIWSVTFTSCNLVFHKVSAVHTLSVRNG